MYAPTPPLEPVVTLAEPTPDPFTPKFKKYILPTF